MPSSSSNKMPVAPALMASPMLWVSSSRRLTTSPALTTRMQAGKATFACFLPAGNTVTLEDEAVAAVAAVMRPRLLQYVK